MTNQMIVLSNAVRLMEEGVILASGQKVKVTDADGNEKLLDMPEEIHTFQGWKDRGFCVRKGEKAVAKFPIWKHSKKKLKNDAGEVEIDENGNEKNVGSMFMQMAAWFTVRQVDPLVTSEAVA